IDTTKGRTLSCKDSPASSTISTFSRSISLRARRSSPLLANASHEASSKPLTSETSRLKRLFWLAIRQNFLGLGRRCPFLQPQASQPSRRRNQHSPFHPTLRDLT